MQRAPLGSPSNRVPHFSPVLSLGSLRSAARLSSVRTISKGAALLTAPNRRLWISAGESSAWRTRRPEEGEGGGMTGEKGEA